jgi:hypothetical protein
MVTKLVKRFAITIGSLLSSGLIIALIGDWLNPPYYNLFQGAWNQNDVTIIGAFIFMVGMRLSFMFVVGKPYKIKKKRRAFTEDTKNRVLKRQNYTCNICGSSPSNWDFDHIGDRSDNSPRNCQALCLDCHRDKTTREARQKKRR